MSPDKAGDRPTACISFNYHRDHFGTTWSIYDAKVKAAHTGCVAFGMDGLAVAMFHAHGTDLEDWPAEIRELLGMTSRETAHSEGWR